MNANVPSPNVDRLRSGWETDAAVASASLSVPARWLAPLCLAATALLASIVAPCETSMAAEPATLIRARVAYTMLGPPQENVEILIRDGKIVGMGDKIEPQGEFRTIDVDTVMPGLVDAASSAGLRGGDAELTREVTPDFETAATLDWQARDFAEAVADGITTVHIMPDTENVISGFACLAKTVGDEGSPIESSPRLVSPRTGMAMAVCSDPTGGNRSRTRPDSIYVRQPTNRMGVVWIIRARLQQARAAMDRDQPADATSELLRGVISGETPVFGVSRTSYDIETLVTLAREFNFQPILFGGHEAYKTIDLLVEAEVPVVYTADPSGSTIGEERTDLFWNTPGKLEQAGVMVCLAGGDLLGRARFATRYGLPAEAALAAITSRPAELLGQGQRLGQIATGFDADLVALDGPPLQFTSAIQWVMVDGQILDSENGK